MKARLLSIFIVAALPSFGFTCSAEQQLGANKTAAPAATVGVTQPPVLVNITNVLPSPTAQTLANIPASDVKLESSLSESQLVRVLAQQETDSKTNERLAKWTKWLALGTVVLAVLTLCLVFEGRHQRKVLTKAVGSMSLTRAEHLTSMLPHFVYERAGLVDPTKNEFDWWFGNHHATSAFLKEVRLSYSVGTTLGLGATPLTVTWNPRVVAKGDYAHIKATLTAVPASKMWIHGEITFDDFTGKERTFGFCLECVSFTRPRSAEEAEKFKAEISITPSLLGTSWKLPRDKTPFEFLLRPSPLDGLKEYVDLDQNESAPPKRLNVLGRIKSFLSRGREPL